MKSTNEIQKQRVMWKNLTCTAIVAKRKSEKIAHKTTATVFWKRQSYEDSEKSLGVCLIFYPFSKIVVVSSPILQHNYRFFALITVSGRDSYIPIVMYWLPLKYFCHY